MNPVFVYILASRHHRHLNVGITANLVAGISAHRKATQQKLGKRFVLQKLIYVEALSNVDEALEREEWLLKADRSAVNRLITQVNPGWDSISVSHLLQEGFAG